MLKPCLLAFVEDLTLQAEMQKVAELKDAEIYFATEGEQLSQLSKTLRPFMVVLDLTRLDAEWLFKHMTTIVNLNPKLPILAFVDMNIPRAVRERAERYGCRTTILKSELLEQLPDLLEKALIGAL